LELKAQKGQKDLKDLTVKVVQLDYQAKKVNQDLPGFQDTPVLRVKKVTKEHMVKMAFLVKRENEETLDYQEKEEKLDLEDSEVQEDVKDLKGFQDQRVILDNLGLLGHPENVEYRVRMD